MGRIGGLHTFDSGTRNPVILSDGTAVFCAWIQMEADGREWVFAGWWESNGRPGSAPVRLGSASKTTWNLNAALDDSGVGWVVFDAEVSTHASEVYVARAEAEWGPRLEQRAVRLTKDDGDPEVYLLTGRPGNLMGEIDGRSQRVVPAVQPWRDGFALAWNEYAPASVEIHDGTSEVFFLSVR